MTTVKTAISRLKDRSVIASYGSVRVTGRADEPGNAKAPSALTCLTPHLVLSNRLGNYPASDFVA
jgi:hypothetical protein